MKRTLFRSILSFIKHKQTNTAGFIAFTGILAVFPFIIFLITLAGFLGQSGMASDSLERLQDWLPPDVNNTLQPVIHTLLTAEHGGLLTFGIIGTLWVVSSGIEALREGVNEAYEVEDNRPFYQKRLQSVLAVFLLGIGILLLTTIVILLPLALELLEKFFYLPEGILTTLLILRYAVGWVVVMGLMLAFYKWLPNHKHGARTVMPGASLAAVIWLMLGGGLSLYLQYTPHYSVTYGTLAGVIITLVFLHYSAMVFLWGAEYNAQRLKEQPKDL